MINANELRIGSLVWYTPFDGNTEEIPITTYNFADLTGETEIAKPEWKERYKPIKLTDEYLVNFGFELFPWGWVKKSSNDFGVRINLRSYNYEVSGNSPVKIEFVHQLQNLFFVLTGEELVVANGS